MSKKRETLLKTININTVVSWFSSKGMSSRMSSPKTGGLRSECPSDDVASPRQQECERQQHQEARADLALISARVVRGNNPEGRPRHEARSSGGDR